MAQPRLSAVPPAGKRRAAFLGMGMRDAKRETSAFVTVEAWKFRGGTQEGRFGAVPESDRAGAGRGSEHPESPESPNRFKTANPDHPRLYPGLSAFPKAGRSAPGGAVPQPDLPWDVFASFPNPSPALRISQPPSQLFVPALTSGHPWMIPPCPCSCVPRIFIDFPCFLALLGNLSPTPSTVNVPWPGMCRITVLLEEQGELQGRVTSSLLESLPDTA